MYTSYDPSLAEAEYASNWNSTDQYQNNPTVVYGGVHSGDVHNSQSNDTYQQADAGSSGYASPYTYQQADPGSGEWDCPDTDR